jgi:hypothetical protein
MTAGVPAVPVLLAGNFALAFLLGPAVVLLADLLESGWPRSGCFPGRVENIPVQRLVTFSSHRPSYKKETIRKEILPLCCLFWFSIYSPVYLVSFPPPVG